jgi:hypothetical protein
MKVFYDLSPDSVIEMQLNLCSAPDAPFSRDEMLAILLLEGVFSPELDQIYYLEGKRERQARRALSRVLRSEASLPRKIRQLLADLLDFKQPKDMTDYHRPVERQLVFRFSRSGKRNQRVKNARVAHSIICSVIDGSSIGQAIEKACETSELGERHVRDIWARYRPLYESWGNIPKPKPDASDGHEVK